MKVEEVLGVWEYDLIFIAFIQAVISRTKELAKVDGTKTINT